MKLLMAFRSFYRFVAAKIKPFTKHCYKVTKTDDSGAKFWHNTTTLFSLCFNLSKQKRNTLGTKAGSHISAQTTSPRADPPRTRRQSRCPSSRATSDGMRESRVQGLTGAPPFSRAEMQGLPTRAASNRATSSGTRQGRLQRSGAVAWMPPKICKIICFCFTD